ncbi:MAG: hypothetical protein P9M03_08650 [Candidatus Theseobacter exili]|nr:hypothetical protein [Candidatus Theseobacter exili]
MNIDKLKLLREKMDTVEDLNALKEEIALKLDKVIGLFDQDLGTDLQYLKKDLEDLQETDLVAGHTREIVGHLVTDFSELKRHLELEL